MAASNDPNQLSPKVRAVASSTAWITLLGLIVGALGTWASGLTPEQFPGLGIWALPVVSLLTGLVNAARAWWASDPLRQDYGAQKAAHEGTASTTYQAPPDVVG